VSLARTLLLKASDSAWLREHGTRAPFVRRAVSRFMPGETFDDMLGATRAMAEQGVAGVFTRLGENVKDATEADQVAAHYLDAVARIRALALACEPSVKLTQLGLDIDPDFAFRHARQLARAAHEAGSFLWVDMEQSPYVDRTLDVVRRLREDVPRVGVCLQAYLLRTPEDLADMIDRGIGVRLVKGAYKEPPTVAYPHKADVDDHYVRLAQTMLADPARAHGSRAVFGTHDIRLIARLREHAAATDVPRDQYEFHMLYGIQRAEQLRLARDGAVVRVLIAYGPYWFPWYMRRLAERPANVWFVAKNLFGRS
jgi:proline dehydrogenase